MRELISAVRTRYPDDHFFADFEESCRINPGKKRYYRTYDDALRSLDPISWEALKQKALNHFLDHRRGQLKQGFFNQLNEAFAYRYLIKGNYVSVAIIPEDGKSRPDIRFGEPERTNYCEVKTLGISEDEIERRDSGEAYNGQVYERLSAGFFNKFQSAIDTANQQILAQRAEGIVFLVLLNDDIALDHYQQYRKQIRSYCRENAISNLYIKIGLRGNRNIRITMGYTGYQKAPLRSAF